MTIQYCSDLHLEFPENWKYLQKKPLIPTGEILVLAGDIIPFTILDKFSDFIDYLSANFAAVYWLPGNHEYYQYNIKRSSQAKETSSPEELPSPAISVFEKIRENLFLVNNRQIRYKDCNLLFSTLWSPLTPEYEWEIRRSVADYRAIRVNDKSLRPSDVNAMHHESRSFLETALKALKAETAKAETVIPETTIVITHHVPTLLNYPSQYKDSPLSGAFAVELFDLIENAEADYWIYGHHHVNTPDFQIGRTKLVTNQLGYVRMTEQRKFRRDAVIDLS